MRDSMRLHDFERIVFFTGAGLSVESGIPTYRGKAGLWHEYNYEDFACQRAFDRAPDRVWDFHDKRREAIGACDPNEGHKIIAQVQREHPGTKIITQNIDGLHQRAGASEVIELHGSIWRIRCGACFRVEQNEETPLGERRCRCGRYWRPDIVWFEDALHEKTVRAAEQALVECDLFVSIGTSAVVYPAAAMPQIAKRAGATLVEVNPEETQSSHLYDSCIRAAASSALFDLYRPVR